MGFDLAQARDIFMAAVEKGDVKERTAFLNDACASNEELRQHVDRLLNAHEQPGSFLDKGAVANGTVNLAISERQGTVIGPYKLLQQIGEGGMGVVFIAEQTEPIQRTVALKIIKPGMDTRQVIVRFEAERQALAMMDHPNIARVIDAGTTETGRPYFVMDLVKGVPITQYCDEQHLTVRERLDLITQVCNAVQHAHQKGIIHRDLKPSNVLVAEYDGTPVPKIIDFGVAKATAQKLTERTMFTEFGQVIGTVEYMSPEQARFNQLDIDTRSDIYSLGVLLYELLTGSTPFERGRLREAAFDEVLRIIRDEEPPKPSSRLSTSDTLPSIAANRHTEPTRLNKDVRGELDWIVMKCLDKDRNRRYDTASSLASDVARYLDDEPVAACPPSRTYRLKKFIRRNKAGVLTGSAVAVALLAGLVLASVGFVEARQQTKIARAEVAHANLALAMVLKSESKGRSKEAVRLAREGLAIRKELFEEDDPRVCSALHILAFILGSTSAEEAIALERESIARQRKSTLPVGITEFIEYPDLAPSLDNLAGLLLRKGEVVEAESLFREALPIYRKFLGNDHPYVANALDHLAATLSKQGKQAEAENCLRESFSIRKKLFGESDPTTIKTSQSLNELLKQRDNSAEAAKQRPPSP